MRLLRLLSRMGSGSIQAYLICMVAALVVVQLALTWVLLSSLMSSITRTQTGERALSMARAMAQIPTIREALLAGDPHGEIQVLADAVRRDTGAAFVVVGDRTGKRYSHPVPERIGQQFVGGDTGPVLNEGKSYVSEAVGTLGRSLRAFVPIRGPDREVIGFVSVGYLTARMHEVIEARLKRPLAYVAVMAALGLVCAVVIARRLKLITLGLEPAEIAALYLERGAVLEAIREGVVAVDRDGLVRLVNRAALEPAGASEPGEVVGRPVEEVLPGMGLDLAMESGRAEHDEEREIRGRAMIVNTVPLFHQGRVWGAAASFRRKDELDRVARELSQVQEYTELLRVQSHEYSNTLHTIAGLIQIEAYQEVLDLVARESSGYQEMIRFLRSAVPHPAIAAIILGKYSRAKELKVDFTVDPESSMVDLPEWMPREKVVTILGNLLENAFEAVLHRPEGARTVNLSFTDLGHEVVFEVEDAGDGIPEQQLAAVFEKGVSTKGKGRRGLGLYLVRRRLDELGGAVTVTEAGLGGTLFTVAIPKSRGGRA